jgi:hypothetical protein
MTDSWLLQSTSIAFGTTLAALAGAWLINHRSYGTSTFFRPQPSDNTANPVRKNRKAIFLFITRIFAALRTPSPLRETKEWSAEPQRVS